MASSGPKDPATDPSRRPPRGSVPNQDGLSRLGSMIDAQGGPRTTPGDGRARTSRASRRRGATGPTSTFDESGLRALGEEIRGNGAKRKPASHRMKKPPRRFRKTKWAVLTVGVVLLVLVGGAGAYAYHLDHEIHHISVKGLVDSPTTGADAGTENILMVGSTDRCALTVQNPAYGLCSEGVTGVNSDVVMILHLDPNKHTVSVLSIPRDLFVPNARTTGANKIDAALYQGPSQLVAAINEDFGIPIQHYVVLNFDTFANVVNDLGGVNMYFPMPVFDAYSGLNQQTTGCIHLDGTEALQVVRARHLQYKGAGVTTDEPQYWPAENLSDLARIRRDHEFLRVLATAVSKNGLSNPVTDTQLVSGVAPQLQVDSSFSLSDMVNLILDFHGVNANSAPQLTLPVEVDQFGSYTYKGVPGYGDIEFPYNTQDQQVIDQFLGVGPTTDTMHGGKLPSPGAVTVSVENGSGTYNQATDTSTALQALGYHVAGIGDVTPVGEQAETVVYYAQMTPADEAAAQTVANSLSGSVIMALDPTQVTDGAQVTVVTGTQFTVNPPAPATPTTAAGATPTTAAAPATTAAAPTTTTTTSASGGAFQAPSAAVTPLQPWDPRSCTPGGGEGT
jgi:LCP family protein required for cell wall assembly